LKQAVILAAGKGQRLRPFTVTKPKAMLSIAGKPIVRYVVEALAENGIRNIVLVVGYRREQIFDYMGAGEQFGVEITYITQERQLGTAHALAQAKGVAEEEFLVLPGNKLIEAETIARFVSAEPEAVLVKRVDNPTRYGVVTVDSGMLKDIVEKPEEAKSNIVNTGIYIFTKEAFAFIEPELDIPAALNNMLAQGYHISAMETKDTWLDVVYPWDILSLNDAVLCRIPAKLGGTIETGASLKGAVSIGEGTVVRSGSYIVGPVVVGANCDVGPNVCILPATSIGDNVVVSPFTEIRNSIIGDDVSIGPSCIIQDSVVDKGCVVKGHFTACSGEANVQVDGEHYVVNVGAMLGEGCSLGNSVVAQPGVIVGNYSQVQPLKLIDGSLPDKSLVF
jgi:UDP-N-acetylglucosamine diphosphorylase/glucosamine-1-phosphate N-acetyltransferase